MHYEQKTLRVVFGWVVFAYSPTIHLFPLGSCKNPAPEGCLLSGKQQHLPFYSYLRRGITLKKSVVADKSEKSLRRIFTC